MIVAVTADRERHTALLRKLQGIRQKVLQHLLQALRIGLDDGRHAGLHGDVELEALVGCERFEHVAQSVDGPFDGHRFRIYLDMARLDLGEVENVIDQIQEVIARRLDRLGELDLLCR